VIRAQADGVRIAIRLAPRASRDRILGPHGGAIKIAITTPPVEGRANQHLVRFLAKKLGVARGAVTIVIGAHARDKVVAVRGVAVDTARERLLG